MASIQKRPDGRWRARIRVDGREIARHFRRKVDAEAWIQRQGAAAQTGDWVDPRAGRVTVQEYAEEWQTLQTWRPSTAARIESMFRLHVYPVLGRRPLAKLRTTELQAWVRDMDLADSTTENLAHVVGGMLKGAVRDRIITRSPMDGVKTPTVETAVQIPLTVEEVAALMAAVPDRWRALVAVGAGCGLRVSEATGLDVAAVDFLRRRVRITRQLITPDRGQGWTVGPTKTRAGTREVPLPQPVAMELAAHLERWPEQDHGFARLIFTADRGGPPRRQMLAAMMGAASKRAGLRTVHYHELRHHYASLLIADGRSVKAVQTALGHATAAETLDTYGHLWPAEGDALAGAVERAWDATQIASKVLRTT